MRFLSCLLVLLILVSFRSHRCQVYGLAPNPIQSFTKDVVLGYERRVAADPSFPTKSIAEVLLAAGTQVAAEIDRRGASNLLGEIDFVVAGVLTAVVGKYYSMWKTAKTCQVAQSDAKDDENKEPTFFGIKVPTNAFQKAMLDGVSVPTLQQRLGSFAVPILPLFRAGCLASLIGYGLVAIMIQLRSILLPAYVPLTQNVNIIHVSLYTGAFMASVSNIRYQILQGIVEPLIDFCFGGIPVLRAMMIFLARVGNGLLGSLLAISGMRWMGVQRLKGS